MFSELAAAGSNAEGWRNTGKKVWDTKESLDSISLRLLLKVQTLLP